MIKRWHVTLVGLCGLLIFLQYRLWFEVGGIQNFMQLRKSIAVQTAENEKLKKRNNDIVFEIERLRNSHDAIEARARNELGMVKKDETFYQIVR